MRENMLLTKHALKECVVCCTLSKTIKFAIETKTPWLICSVHESRRSQGFICSDQFTKSEETMC